MNTSELEAAYVYMHKTKNPSDEGRFFDLLMSAEVLLLLNEGGAQEAGADVATLARAGVDHVMAFEDERRLAEIVPEGGAYLEVPMRTLVESLTQEGLGLALNPQVSDLDMVFSPEIVAWLAEMMREPPQQHTARVEEILPPVDVPEAVIEAISAALSRTRTLRDAHLVAARYEGGRIGYLLMISGAAEEIQAAVVEQVQGALRFRGGDQSEIDVSFVAEGDEKIPALLARIGLRMALPRAVAPSAPKAPGSDPDAPPRL